MFEVYVETRQISLSFSFVSNVIFFRLFEALESSQDVLKSRVDHRMTLWCEASAQNPFSRAPTDR